MEKMWSQLNNTADKRAALSSKASMPILDHLSRKDFEHVYEPSDDTYLMLDALSYEYENNPNYLSKLCSTSNTIRSLEIGCGTGTVTIHFAKLCQSFLQGRDRQESSNVLFIHHVTDINPKAIDVTKRTAIVNGICCIENSVIEPLCVKELNSKCVIQPWTCDLASPLLNDLSGKIDFLFFNPPYVCTPDEEVGGCGIEASWAGGENGRVVLDRALPQIASLLAFPHGVAYVITIDENLPQEIAQLMQEKYCFDVEPLLRRKCKNECLTVQKMTRNRMIRPS